MTPEARKMTELLHDEHQAALRADVDALVRIQAEKRIAVEVLRAQETPNDVLIVIEEHAQRNVQLIGHLVRSLRAFVSETSPTTSYSPHGVRMDAALTATRGRL